MGKLVTEGLSGEVKFMCNLRRTRKYDFGDDLLNVKEKILKVKKIQQKTKKEKKT